MEHLGFSRIVHRSAAAARFGRIMLIHQHQQAVSFDAFFRQTLFELAELQILEPSVQPCVSPPFYDTVAFDISIKDEMVFVEQASDAFPMQLVDKIVFAALHFVEVASPGTETLADTEGSRAPSAQRVQLSVASIQGGRIVVHLFDTSRPKHRSKSADAHVDPTVLFRPALLRDRFLARNHYKVLPSLAHHAAIVGNLHVFDFLPTSFPHLDDRVALQERGRETHLGAGFLEEGFWKQHGLAGSGFLAEPHLEMGDLPLAQTLEATLVGGADILDRSHANVLGRLEFPRMQGLVGLGRQRLGQIALLPFLFVHLCLVPLLFLRGDRVLFKSVE